MGNGYVTAGYGLIWISLLAYAWRIRRRLVVAERDLAGASQAEPTRQTLNDDRGR